MPIHIQYIATCSYGSVFTCGACDALHLEFGMLCARFDYDAFVRFHDFLVGLDVETLLARDPMNDQPSRVRIALPPSTFGVALTLQEVDALRHLLHDGWVYVQQFKNSADMDDLFAGIETWLNATDSRDAG